MRIKRFDLIAYGPFTDYRLDFDLDQPQLHIIYGTNEAGKSSALRGLKAWLYGIDHQTRDNFIHDYHRLRLGGILVDEQGRTLHFIRRKGQRNVLLAADGRRPVDEKILQSFLKGVSKQHFEHFFALNHADLIAGGQALVAQKGELGQSLFSAALGHRNLHKISKDLEKKAEALFKPKGSKPVLNQLLSEYDQLRKKIRQGSLSASDWQRIQQDLQQSRQRLQAVEKHWQAVQDRLNYWQVLKKIFPLLQEEKIWRDRLGQMDQVVILDQDFSRKRQEAEQRLQQAQYEWQLLQQQQQRLQQKIEAIQYDAQLVMQADSIESLYAQLGRYEQAQLEQMHLRNQRDEIKEQIAWLWKKIPQSDRRLLGILSRQQYWRTQLIEPYEHLYRSYQKAEQAWQAQQQILSNLEYDEQWPRLNEVFNHLQAHLYLDQSCAEKEKAWQQIEAQLKAQFDSISLWTQSLEALLNYQPPLRSEIEYQQKRWQDIQQNIQQIEQQQAEQHKDLLKIKKRLHVLEQQLKQVPQLDDLQQSRQYRDQIWHSIQLAQRFDAQLHADLSRWIQRSDELADRLLEAADRLREWHDLQAECQRVQDQIQYLKQHEQNYRNEQQAWQSHWQQIWRPLKPLSPTAMLDWYKDYEQIKNLAQQKIMIEYDWSRLKQKRQQLLSSWDQGDGRIASALHHIQQRIAAYHHWQEQKKKLQELEAQYQQCQKDLVAWQDLWQKEMRYFQLPEDMSLQAVEELLQYLAAIDEKEKESLRLQNRLQDIEAETQFFAEQVKQKLKELAPQFLSLPVDKAIRRLYQLLKEQQLAQQEWQQYQAELDPLLEQVARKKDEYEQAQSVLHELCQQAQVNHIHELKQAEERSQQYQKWQQLKQRIQSEARPFSLAQLRQEQISLEDLEQKIQHLQQEKQHLEAQKNHLLQEQGRLQKELELRGRGEDQVLQWAEQAESIRAELYEQAEYYAQLKAAQLLLQQSIEYYRQHHQDPLLQKSSVYFERLTLGSFRRLVIDFNREDQMVLAGEKADGRILQVEAMSKGVQDQLYLALRLAALENYADQQISLPFIIDDVLVDFDDQRSQAALQILAELSHKMQVIIFTHHRHLIAQAQPFAHQLIELKSFFPKLL